MGLALSCPLSMISGSPMSTSPRHPNAALAGVPGGRQRLDTPALLLDLDAMARNIARMAQCAAGRGVGLRPHVKTHKSVEIARRQLAAGAIGVSCVTLGEAETMAMAGLPGVLITSPIVTAGKICRLVELASGAAPGEVMVVVDHPRNVDDLAAAAGALAHPLHVLIDYAAGYGRTGAADAAAVLALARRVESHPTLHLRGLQAYAGNIQHIGERERRTAAAAAVRSSVRQVIEAAAAAGIRFGIVTGGGTGSHDLDAQDDLFTELQVGSYVFMDADYSAVLAAGAASTAFDVALLVQAAVVSVNQPGWVTVDAGTKAFATDSGVPLVAGGPLAGAVYAFAGDEHGRLEVVAGQRPQLGDRVEFVTPHCDPTVNLHGVYHVVSGDTLVDIWPVDARGR
jgi:3-hydroxy-D-aspartate aldolase